MAARPRRSESADRADRRVGWLVGVSSLLLGVWWVPDAVDQWDRFPAWWSIGAWAVAVSFLALAAFGLRLPMGVLRSLWLAVPVLLIGLQLLSFGAVLGDPAEVLPWVWLFEAPAVCLLALRLPAVAAVAVSLLSSLSVPLSAWFFTGAVPYLVMTNTPMRLGNVVFIALVIGVRRRLTRLHEAEAEARAAAERRARSAAEAEERARFSRFVHDEVLSVLAAARLFSGEPPPELRAEAAATIGELDAVLTLRRAPAPHAGARIAPALAAEGVRARLARIAPAAEFVVEAAGEAVDAAPVEALGAAAAEAVRNAVRHSGARRIAVRIAIVDGSIEMSVADDGAGFDASTATRARLGVRESIVARVSESGGVARVVSAPGAGTEVRLSWTP